MGTCGSLELVVLDILLDMGRNVKLLDSLVSPLVSVNILQYQSSFAENGLIKT